MATAGVKIVELLSLTVQTVTSGIPSPVRVAEGAFTLITTVSFAVTRHGVLSSMSRSAVITM